MRPILTTVCVIAFLTALAAAIPPGAPGAVGQVGGKVPLFRPGQSLLLFYSTFTQMEGGGDGPMPDADSRVIVEMPIEVIGLNANEIELQITLRRLAFEVLDGDSVAFSMDTAALAPGDDGYDEASLFMQMVFVATVDSTGQLTSFDLDPDTLEEIQAGIDRDARESLEEGQAAMNDAFRSALATMLAYAPPEGVGMDSEWTVERTDIVPLAAFNLSVLTGGAPALTESVICGVESITNINGESITRIGFSGDSLADYESERGSAMGMDVPPMAEEDRPDLTISSGGRMEIDVNTGRFYSLRIDSVMTGDERGLGRMESNWDGDEPRFYTVVDGSGPSAAILEEFYMLGAVADVDAQIAIQVEAGRPGFGPTPQPADEGEDATTRPADEDDPINEDVERIIDDLQEISAELEELSEDADESTVEREEGWSDDIYEQSESVESAEPVGAE